MRFAYRFTLLLAFFLLLTVTALAEDVYIDGEKVPYDDTTGYPFSEEGVVLVPLYPTFEAFGNDGIIQDNPNGTVVITKGDISVSCNTTEKGFARNGTKIKAPRGLVWKGGPLYVPTDIFTAFDADVYINGSGVIITRNSGNSNMIFGSVADENYRGSLFFGEKYEPRNGLLLGCFSEGDALSGLADFSYGYGRNAAAFTVRLGCEDDIKKYDKELKYAAESGRILRLELCNITDDETYVTHLSEMAQYLEASGARILLCPMPGITCTRCDVEADMEKYKNDFIRISDIFRSKAPSAAMVWQMCSCNIPQAGDMYPGDMYVHYAEICMCEGEKDILGKLSYFTSAYSYKKPVILKADISATDNELCRELLNYLPVRYPSVKAVFLPDLSAKNGISGSFLNIIRSGVQNPSYIEDPNSRADDTPYYFRFGNDSEVPATKVRIYSGYNAGTAYVIYKLNGEQISPPVKEMPFEAVPDFSKYAGETVNIEAVMYDTNNKPCAITGYTVNVGTKVTDADAPIQKTHPAVYIVIILVSLAGIFVTVKKINDIFL